MRSWLLHGAVPMVLSRLIVGAIYVWFGINKVADPVAFLKALREYEILPLSPPHWMNLTVVVLPWVEILCGALLIVGAFLRAAGVLLLAMTVVFTAAIVLRGLAEAGALGIPFCDVGFDCGCGIGYVQVCDKLLENVALILLSIVVVTSRSRAWSAEALRTATA